MFQQVGMKEKGGPLPLAFQYLFLMILKNYFCFGCNNFLLLFLVQIFGKTETRKMTPGQNQSCFLESPLQPLKINKSQKHFS